MKKILIVALIMNATGVNASVKVQNNWNKPILFEFEWAKDGKMHKSAPMSLQPGEAKVSNEGDGFAKYRYTVYAAQGTVKALDAAAYIKKWGEKGIFSKHPDLKSAPLVDVPNWQPIKHVDYDDGRYDNRLVTISSDGQGGVLINDKVRAHVA